MRTVILSKPAHRDNPHKVACIATFPKTWVVTGNESDDGVDVYMTKREAEALRKKLEKFLKSTK